MKKKKKVSKIPNLNPVAKHANKVNRASRHKDKKNDYKRKDKHPGRDRDSFCQKLLDSTQKVCYNIRN